jgi:ankyrin repeat protein
MASRLSQGRDGVRAAAVVSLALLASQWSSSAAANGVAAAAREADLDAVRAELGAGADVNAPDSEGTSALLWAAYHSVPELVSLLLAAGADPNTPSQFGVTPLLQATRNGDAATTRALLDTARASASSSGA